MNEMAYHFLYLGLALSGIVRNAIRSGKLKMYHTWRVRVCNPKRRYGYGEAYGLKFHSFCLFVMS